MTAARKTDRGGDGPIRLGSRKSPLAMAQARMAAAAIGRVRPDIEVEIVRITSEGDRDLRTRLDRFSQPGIFTRSLEKALRDGRIDGAVHSAKDLPSALDPGFRLTGALPREDAHDTLVAREGAAREGGGATLESLLPGARIGSCSPRRVAQLKRVRGDLRFCDLRGNLQTRLGKLDGGEVDAILLAAAGLKRLGLGGRISESIPFALCLPAAGQGVVVLECLEECRWSGLFDSIASLESRLCLEAERALLRTLGAGCSAAVAGHALLTGGELTLRGRVLDVDGVHLIEGEVAENVDRETVENVDRGVAHSAAALGVRLGEELLSQGAAGLL
jgi:hydroxymethylbilane synthase